MASSAAPPSITAKRIAHLEGRPHFHLHYADLGDSMSIVGVVADVRPTEIYNLAARATCRSASTPRVHRRCRCRRRAPHHRGRPQGGLANSCKIYQASTSELYGKVEEVPRNENTPFHPFSPYAVAKQYGFGSSRSTATPTACSAAMASSSTTRASAVARPSSPVKITLAAARIAQGLQDKLYLGNPRLACARLGLRQGLRRVYVAHPPGPPARGLRHCHGRAAQRPRSLPSSPSTMSASNSNGRAKPSTKGHLRQRPRPPRRQDPRGGFPRLLPPHRRRQPRATPRRPAPNSAGTPIPLPSRNW